MSNNFDPNIPSNGPGTPTIEGRFTTVKIAEQNLLGKSNLVINGGKAFDIEVAWKFEGNLTPLWLTALSVDTKDWVVTAYANPRGPGNGLTLGTVNVPIGGPPFGDPEAFKATITVPANTLDEETPGDPTHSGVYQLTVTVFLDSDLGPVGFDMMGVADFPLIKVENPE